MLKLLVFVCCFSVLRVAAGRYSGDDDHLGMEYYVGNWTSGANFTEWSQGKTFYLGDRLTFTVTGSNSLVPVHSKDEYESCKWAFPKDILPASNQPMNVTFVLLLEDNYFISVVEDDCKAGLKLMVKALSRPLAPPPPVYNPKTYTIGDDQGWSLGVNYNQWTENKDFYYGDVFKFIFNASQHSVVEVSEGAFDNCNQTFFPRPFFGRGELQSDGRTVLTIIPHPGSNYFVSSMTNDCQQGLKVELEIEPTNEAFDAPAPSPAPGGSSAVAGQDSSDGCVITPQFGLVGLLVLPFFM